MPSFRNPVPVCCNPRQVDPSGSEDGASSTTGTISQIVTNPTATDSLPSATTPPGSTTPAQSSPASSVVPTMHRPDSQSPTPSSTPESQNETSASPSQSDNEPSHSTKPLLPSNPLSEGPGSNFSFPIPDSVTTYTSVAPISSGSSPSSPSAVTAVRSTSSKAGPIAGGVIGGLILLALIVLGAFLWRRRRNRRRIAPSAEFMHHNRLTPSLSHSPAVPLTGSYTDTEDDPPPPFTRGSYNDPVLEKVSAAQAQREMYAATGSPRGIGSGTSVGMGMGKGNTAGSYNLSPFRDDVLVMSSVHTSASVGSPLRNITPDL
ncbi:hypothetical protein NLI96_g8433 [Meripilus lineatus]|uniref:Mid2 domain-containing protein n=1 Tax=Meripilus lineatus TaxID=2056292 RepID=A0AAD5UXK8_9APHY|nr:hypothetical protein NLI96_g8433 [Physisporinus lineatus]